MDQDDTWYEVRPRPRPSYVKWGPSCPTERGTAAKQPPNTFVVHGRRQACIRINRGPYLLQRNGRMDQDQDQHATWYGGRLRPRRHCVRRRPALPPQGEGTAATASTFRPMSIVAKRLDGSKCHLVYSFHRPSLRPSLFPFLPSVDSIRGLAHAAGFAAARRCLRFLVYCFVVHTVQDSCRLSRIQFTTPDATQLDSFAASAV